MASLSSKEISDLHDARKASRRDMEFWLKIQTTMLKQLMGKLYTEDDGSKHDLPLNVLEMWYSIYLRQLVANAPRAMVSTQFPPLDPVADAYQLSLNGWIKSSDFQSLLHECTADALLGMGVMKIARAMPDEQGVLTTDMFTKRVSVSDFVADMQAKGIKHTDWMGHQFRMPKQELERIRGVSKKDVNELTTMSSRNKFGDDEIEPAYGIGRDYSSFQPFREYVEMWEIWIRETQTLYWVRPDNGQPLLELPWRGPPKGPYTFLGFKWLPDQVLPANPASYIYELHKAINLLLRKTIGQAYKQKTVGLVQGQSTDDGKTVVGAADWSLNKVLDPKSTMFQRMGGPDQVTLAFIIQLWDMASKAGNNIELLGGLSPQADTLGQEQLLAQSSSRVIADMQDAVIAFTGDSLREVGWYLWNDPNYNPTIRQNLDGSDEFGYDADFSWEARAGEFDQYDIRIEPYSQAHRTPQTRLQTLLSIFERIIMPLAASGQMQAQGLGVDLRELFKAIVEDTNMPEIGKLINDVNYPEGQESGQPGGQGGSFSHRINERRNTPGAKVDGKNQAFVQALMGQQLQPAEQAQMAR